MPLSGDQIVFLMVALILASCLINTFEVFRRQKWDAGEVFWLYGLVSLSVSYLSYGLSTWLGRPGLMIANIAFLASYVSLAFQLRFWRTKKSNIPSWVLIAGVAYALVFEFSRDYLPYLARASLGQAVSLLLVAHLIWASVHLYRQKKSRQIFLLQVTFFVELCCLLVRIIMLWMQPDTTANTISLLSEPFWMMVVRWVLVVANAMSYLTIMTFTLEKTFDSNHDLAMLIKEKQILINTMSKMSRSQQAGGMASAMAHELSQPLSTLLLLAKNLNDQVNKNNLNDLKELANILSAETSKSAKILLQLEKLFLPKNSERHPVMISEIIRGAMSVHSTRLSINQIRVEKHGDFDVEVMAEPTQLELVFINLISNSIGVLSNQAGSRQIELKCSNNHHHCTIEVHDNGPGISPEVLGRIGEMYVSDRQSGSGVGLWLTKEIIESHGGELIVSNQEKAGASFSVILPVL